MGKKAKIDLKSGWQFCLINGKLAELFFHKGIIDGYCYVHAKDYKTKEEQKWIEEDIKNLRILFRKGKYWDMIRKKQIPSAPKHKSRFAKK